MKSRRPVSDPSQILPRGKAGFSLVELAVTVAIGAIVLVVLGMLVSYGIQSFWVMGNCSALDESSRLAADHMTRELRQATRVVSYDVQPESKKLVLTNSVQGYSVEYSWQAENRTVTCEKTDQATSVCLRDCDVWEAAFFQNVPLASLSHPYLPATNQLGTLDLNLARIVSLSWKCSRAVAGNKSETEGTHSLQIALRNAAQP